MVNYQWTDLPIEYLDVVRNWDPKSEAYAGADNLLTALYRGWAIQEIVHCEVCRQDQRLASGNRAIIVFYFELYRADETMVMPVVSNPCLERLLASAPLKVVYAEDVADLYQIW